MPPLSPHAEETRRPGETQIYLRVNKATVNTSYPKYDAACAKQELYPSLFELVANNLGQLGHFLIYLNVRQLAIIQVY